MAGMAFRKDNVVPDHESELSELSEQGDWDGNPNPWIKVVPRHTCSLDSLSRALMNKDFITTNKNIKALKTGKEAVLSQTENQLTAAQKQQMSHCWEKVQEKPHVRVESSA